jgi:hypothetical protein
MRDKVIEFVAEALKVEVREVREDTFIPECFVGELREKLGLPAATVSAPEQGVRVRTLLSWLR